MDKPLNFLKSISYLDMTEDRGCREELTSGNMCMKLDPDSEKIKKNHGKMRD